MCKTDLCSVNVGDLADRCDLEMSLQFMLFFLYATLLVSDGRRFTECELAEELKKNNISDQHISTYVCIAKRVSNLYTDIISDNFVCYGIFQISSVYWWAILLQFLMFVFLLQNELKRIIIMQDVLINNDRILFRKYLKLAISSRNILAIIVLKN